MAAAVGIGGAIGAGLGALAIPILGPAAAVPIIGGLALAGGGIGLRAGFAERVKEVVLRGLNIIDRNLSKATEKTFEIVDKRTREFMVIIQKRSEEGSNCAVKVTFRVVNFSLDSCSAMGRKIGKFSDFLLSSGEKVLNTTAKYAVVAGVNYLALKYIEALETRKSSETCLVEPEEITCEWNTYLQLLAGSVVACSVVLMVGKATSGLFYDMRNEIVPDPSQKDRFKELRKRTHVTLQQVQVNFNGLRPEADLLADRNRNAENPLERSRFARLRERTQVTLQEVQANLNGLRHEADLLGIQDQDDNIPLRGEDRFARLRERTQDAFQEVQANLNG